MARKIEIITPVSKINPIIAFLKVILGLSITQPEYFKSVFFSLL
jgi:hypothetical protein